MGATERRSVSFGDGAALEPERPIVAEILPGTARKVNFGGLVSNRLSGATGERQGARS
jgi:hypothetical protein